MHLMGCTSSDRYLTQINELLMSLKSHSRKLTVIIQNEMLRRLERVFRCCSVCETMEDYKEGI